METTVLPREDKELEEPPAKGGVLIAWAVVALAIGVAVGGVIYGPQLLKKGDVPIAAALPPGVTVSTPLQRDIEGRSQFLGQFSGVRQVDVRAQVGGTLIEIGFKDGDIVKKGDLLFAIDPEPYEIKMSQAVAVLESAKARAELAERQLERAEALKKSDAGSTENVDQRAADNRSAKAAVADAEAQVRDAKFDLDHCRIVAPFAGRIGTHLVSVGNLIAGSRAASSPTTLLATVVSLDPIWLNFDMSEAEFMSFAREKTKSGEALTGKVEVSLSDESDFTRVGKLDFIDNILDRTSGTIHARATVPNADLFLKPGGFARVRLTTVPATKALLVPDASVLADQSEHIVLTVNADNTVTPKFVKLGDLRGGLRVIRSGLDVSDRVIIDGIAVVRPGMKVSPTTGALSFDNQTK